MVKIEDARFEFAAGRPDQLPPSDLPEIVFSGKSNVGKSSLINALLRRKSLARVSATPGKTGTINFYHVGAVRLVDLPGYGYAKVSHTEKKRWAELVEGYLGSARHIRLLVQLLDIRHPPTENDRQMVGFLMQSGFPFLLVATKADKLKKSQRENQLAMLADTFQQNEGVRIPILPFSSVSGEGVEELRRMIVSIGEDAAVQEEPGK